MVKHENIKAKAVTSALMSYLRYKRGWICADEVRAGSFNADVLADTGNHTIEYEIKVTKNDLYGGEARKKMWNGSNKHDKWLERRPNKFCLCVPEYLKEHAVNWIEETNNKYGLLIFTGSNEQYYEDYIKSFKSPLMLHKKYGNIDYKEKILMRLSSCRCLELKRKCR